MYPYDSRVKWTVVVSDTTEFNSDSIPGLTEGSIEDIDYVFI